MTFLEILEKTRLIAILRGITPSEVLEVSSILVESGIRIIEIPLNSPKAFESIEILTNFYKNKKDMFIGAGTVCNEKELEELKKINATLVVSPNTNIELIKKTKLLNMISIPGFITPSEAYNAIQSGATCLKLFPFRKFGIEYYKDIKVVLPKNIALIVVGGIDENNIKIYLENKIKYFGIASSLYKPKMNLNLLKEKADFFVQAMKEYNV